MLYFIINPHSGNGNGRATADKLKTFLADVPYTVIFTQQQGDATVLAAQCCQKEDCAGVVAVGGDGTVNEVVNGMDLRVPLGVIASGSGNDFLRTFAPGSTLKEQLAPIREGKTRQIDLLHINDLRSLNVAGTGFDVDILLRQAKLKRVLKGSAGYFASLLITLFSMKFRTFTLSFDGGETRTIPALLLVLANGRFFGGGLPASPDASLTDGKISVVLIKKLPRWKIPYVLIRFLKGRIAEVKRYTEVFTCTRVEGSVLPAVSLQLDGELFDLPRFVCTVAPRELTIFG